MKCMLTTIDNPYNPFIDFKKWYLFDVQNGYNSSSYLARIARISDEMTEKENDEEIERAIDEIIDHDFMHVYVKIRNDQEIN